jgi:hypothetical protein
MSSDEKGTRPRRLRIETVHGEPYLVRGRTLVPVARMISLGKARGMVGAQRIGGWGGSLAWVMPVAVIDRTGDGERRIPIRDATADRIWGLLGRALVVTLFCTTVRWLVLRRRQSRTD